MAKTVFNQQLEAWLKAAGHKTYGSLEATFGTKTYAVLFVLLMITAALPLPTGGLTHIFELATMLLSLRLIFGANKVWLPNSLKNRQVSQSVQIKVIPKLIGFIKWVESLSRPRLRQIMTSHMLNRLVGILVLVFSVAAFVAPPFSGLDTLPALGVVLAGLALLFEDAVLLAVAAVAGASGIALELVLGSVVWHFLR